jgi:glycine oxidase
LTPSPANNRHDVIVVGAGVVGLACAWRAAQRGMSVLVAERDAPGSGASGVAAGMLAPVTEADFGEEEQLRENLDAAARWPTFAAELEERSGMPTGYRATGALVVAADRDDAAELHRLHDFQRASGLDAEWLTPSSARALEPGLSPRIAGAIDAPAEAVADPPAVVAALAVAAREAGVEIRAGMTVEALDAAAILTAEGRMEAGAVVLAAGAWSGDLLEQARVRPVKGQLLHLRARRGAELPATRIIRTPRCYVVPRADGRVVIGATMEEQGFDTTPTADAVFRLLEAAHEVLPDVGELQFDGVVAGLRPATPDNRPLVGEADGVILATGHWRNGVLLAPVTADRVTSLLTGDKVHA